MKELYGWKGFRRLAASAAAHAAVMILLAILLLTRPDPLWALAVGALAFVGLWLWHLLLPELFRFNLVFMPRLMEVVRVPFGVLLLGGGAVAAFGPAGAQRGGAIAVSVVLSSSALVALAVAVLLWLSMRSERRAAEQMEVEVRAFSRDRSEAEVGRLKRYVDQRIRCSTPGMPIRGIEFPGLTSRPWHDPAHIPWTKVLEGAFESLRAEILGVLDNGGPTEQYSYPGVSSSNWQHLILYHGKKGYIAENCQRLPKTTALLKALPMTPYREAMVSILAGRARIPPHRDGGNLTLTCQLAIRFPEAACGIRVGAERRSWELGKCIVFDTSYEHEVWNDSDEPRIVLLFDFLHPDLTPTELAFFEHWFKLRRPKGG